VIPLEQLLANVETCLGGGAPPGMLARDEAARTVHAVLAALALRLSVDDRCRLAAELPGELGDELAELDLEGEAPLGDTLGRVAAELELDEETAARRLACVIGELRRAVSRDTWRSLPSDVAALAR
jgi:uncharacterized protein (DUF2267 family)